MYRILDLFSGLGGWSAPFQYDPHWEVITCDCVPDFLPTICGDFMRQPTRDLLHERGPYDVILASPPCEAFSVASIGKYWKKEAGGAMRPKHPKAAHAWDLARVTVEFIEDESPEFFIIENPRGILRKLSPYTWLTRRTITQCQYGMPYMKPTDLWGYFPPSLELKPACKNGDPCHVRAPRGARTGLQAVRGAANRAVIPYELA